MQLARAEARPRPEPFAVVCVSHVRWDFVWHPPHQFLSRLARERQVVFFEEPLPTDGPATLELSPREEGVIVAVPHLPHGLSPERTRA